MEILVSLAAAIGAWVNSVAGGGTFLTFPLLTLLGYSALQANMISTIALWPGAAASAVAYRNQSRHILKSLPLFIFASLAGSAIGASLLLNLPEKTFEFLVPWLLLFAATLLTFGPKLKTWLAHRSHHPDGSVHDWKDMPASTRIKMCALQFLISVYGGYFGAGIGILMLAVLQFAPFKDIHEMNAVKVILGTAINAIAFLLFILFGDIDWHIASWMLAGGIVGGYVGTNISLKISPTAMRVVILVIAWMMTTAYLISFFSR